MLFLLFICSISIPFIRGITEQTPGKNAVLYLFSTGCHRNSLEVLHRGVRGQSQQPCSRRRFTLGHRRLLTQRFCLNATEIAFSRLKFSFASVGDKLTREASTSVAQPDIVVQAIESLRTTSISYPALLFEDRRLCCEMKFVGLRCAAGAEKELDGVS